MPSPEPARSSARRCRREPQSAALAADVIPVERRAQRVTTPILMNCRHCLHHQALYVERMELKRAQPWYRCRNCENWFAIRRDDAIALRESALLHDSLSH